MTNKTENAGLPHITDRRKNICNIFFRKTDNENYCHLFGITEFEILAFFVSHPGQNDFLKEIHIFKTECPYTS